MLKGLPKKGKERRPSYIQVLIDHVYILCKLSNIKVNEKTDSKGNNYNQEIMLKNNSSLTIIQV